MCEFKVFLDGELVAESVMYAKEEDGKVVVRGIIGEAKVFEGAVITEVDVLSTRLILTRT